MVMNRPLKIRIVGLCLILLVAAAGSVSSWHHHDDSKFHDDCLLCRFQIEGNATHADTALIICAHLVVSGETLSFVELAVPATGRTPWHLPNAPPIS